MKYTIKTSPRSYHIRLLAAELDARRKKNPRYSLRGFSRLFGVDPSALSRMLRGKQEVSSNACVAILKKLDLPAVQQRLFVRSVLSETIDEEYERILKRLPSARPSESSSPLPPAVYQKLADLNHSALLELTSVQGFQSDPQWIGRQLGITEQHAKWIISLLLKAGHLSKDGDRLVRTDI